MEIWAQFACGANNPPDTSGTLRLELGYAVAAGSEEKKAEQACGKEETGAGFGDWGG